MFLALTQLVSIACKPYSPNVTKLLLVALHFILPRWLLRYLTLFGIIAIFSALMIMADSFIFVSYLPMRRKKTSYCRD
jgi:hypothetical protein